MKILIAIPCYNCAPQVQRVFSGLEQLPGIDAAHRILFIDNGSQDKTVQNLLDYRSKSPLRPKVFIAQNKENYGLGGTHKVAFQHSLSEGFDAVIILHGDDQANTQDILPLIAKSIEEQKTILGSRFMPRSLLENYSFTRIFGNRVLNLVFTLVTRRRTLDLGSGLNLFLVRDLKHIPFMNLSDSFNFNVDLLLEFYRNDVSVAFMPIHWREKDQVSNARNFNVAFRMLGSLKRWLFKQYPSQPPRPEYVSSFL